MKNLFWSLLLLIVLQSCKTKQTAVMKQPIYEFYVGTYTQNQNQGVNAIQLNTNTQRFEVKEVINGLQNPSFLQYNPINKCLYVSEEIDGKNGGTITSFKFDSLTQKHQKINTVNTQGAHPCVMALSPDKKWLIAGNYSGGNLSVFKMNDNGTLSESVQTLQHFGNSINKERQEKPHIHDVVFHQTNSQVYVADLGTDRIYIYDFDAESTTPLSPSQPSFISLKKGSGPRHLAFDSNGTYVYVVQELTAEVSMYQLQENQIEHIQTLPLANEEKSNLQGSGAEIKFSPNQKYLYVSNRGKVNEIVVFAIDQSNHQLVRIQNISTQGTTPRSFEITPDGKFLLVANQDSLQIQLFEIQSNGKLKQSELNLSINQPTHIINK